MPAEIPFRLNWESHPAQLITDSPELRNQWNALNAATTRLVFMDAEAIHCALKHFGSGKERLFVGRDQQRVLCMAVVKPVDWLRWSTFQPSQIPLGAFLLAPDATLSEVSGGLLRALPGFPLALSITQLDPHFVPRPAHTSTLRTADYIETGWIELTGSFDEYWAARSKNLRNNMRKQANKLANDGTRIEFRAIQKPDQIAEAVIRYGELESTGWKAQQGTAVNPGNVQGRFYSELMSEAAKKSGAIVYEYWLEDKLVASNLCVERDKTLIILKTTYSEQYNRLSPAFLLRLAEIQSAFTTGTTARIELYGRKREWHLSWTNHFRTIYHTTIYRTPLIRLLAEIARLN